jgi:p-cumate 2,3-dioxygenase beta subunit
LTNDVKLSPAPVSGVTRQEVEDFLFEEASLLDDWRLYDWLDLLTPDATYQIPTTDRPDGNASTDLFLVADDAFRLRSRVRQLMGRNAWIEYPRSRTRRVIGNVRIMDVQGNEIHVTANFIVYRIRYNVNAPYIGHYDHVLIHENGQLKIKKRSSIIDNECLDLHGAVAFIL